MAKLLGIEICIHLTLLAEIKQLLKGQKQNLYSPVKEQRLIVTKLKERSAQKTQSELKGSHPTQGIRIPNLEEREKLIQKGLQLKQTRIPGQKILTSKKIILRDIQTQIETKQQKSISRLNEILRTGIKQPRTLINHQSEIQILKAIIHPGIRGTIHQSLIHRQGEIIHPEPRHHHALLLEDRIMVVEGEADNF